MKTGKAITYKGTTKVHAHDAPEVRGWFFEAFARRLHRGNNKDRIAAIAADLDAVLEFTPAKAISYDGDKLAASVPGLEGGFEKLFS